MTRSSIARSAHYSQCRSPPRAQQQVASAQPQTASAPQPASAPHRQPPRRCSRAAQPPFPNRAERACCPRGCACAASSASASKDSTSSGFIEDRDDGYCAQPLPLQRDRHGLEAACRFKPTCRMRASPTKKSVRRRRRSEARSICGSAFADVGDAKAPVAARLGRQELAFGEQRLVGHLGWVNTGRTLDAARVILRAKALQVDVFGASVVRSLADEFDKSGNGNRLAGAYAHVDEADPAGDGRAVRVLAPRRQPARASWAASATSQQTTMGVRIAGKLPARLDYGVEMAVQRGSLGADDVSAWAGHWQLRESLPGAGAVEADLANTTSRPATTNPTDGVAQHLRSALSHRPRQARPGRSGRLAQHPPPARGRRVHAVQGDARSR